MKKNILLLSLAAALAALAGCAEDTATRGCRIDGSITLDGGFTTAVLTAADGSRVDSCRIVDGQFTLSDTTHIARPYMATLLVAGAPDPSDRLCMPVAVENGTVKVGLNEYILLDGTPLNKRVKAFLDALQQCKDGVSAQPDITAEKVKEIFSDFYVQQILSNRGNALGRYIYDKYGVHLDEADSAQIKAEMENEKNK